MSNIYAPFPPHSQVTKDDKMPQTMCSLCVDKINDFYEFREMCYATNKQTRNLLGLKQADPQKVRIWPAH